MAAILSRPQCVEANIMFTLQTAIMGLGAITLTIVDLNVFQETLKDIFWQRNWWRLLKPVFLLLLTHVLIPVLR